MEENGDQHDCKPPLLHDLLKGSYLHSYEPTVDR